jgi:hypothetical protein
MVGRGERTDAERGEEAKWILRELKLSHSVDEEAAIIAIEKVSVTVYTHTADCTTVCYCS